MTQPSPTFLTADEDAQSDRPFGFASPIAPPLSVSEPTQSPTPGSIAPPDEFTPPAEQVRPLAQIAPAPPEQRDPSQPLIEVLPAEEITSSWDPTQPVPSTATSSALASAFDEDGELSSQELGSLPPPSGAPVGGTSGWPGPAGAPGPAGVPGPAGIAGPPGIAGPAGALGPAGAPRPAGAPGPAGQPRPTMPTGSPGLSATPGPAVAYGPGQPGFPGAQAAGPLAQAPYPTGPAPYPASPYGPGVSPYPVNPYATGAYTQQGYYPAPNGAGGPQAPAVRGADAWLIGLLVVGLFWNSLAPWTLLIAGILAGVKKLPGRIAVIICAAFSLVVGFFWYQGYFYIDQWHSTAQLLSFVSIAAVSIGQHRKLRRRY